MASIDGVINAARNAINLGKNVAKDAVKAVGGKKKAGALIKDLGSQGATIDDVIKAALSEGITWKNFAQPLGAPSVANTGLTGAENVLQYAQDLATYNTGLSQDMAREQMEFQRESQEQAMTFNAQEAAKERSYLTDMSNTAHQREVADLIASGLNPILSANGGASVNSSGIGSVSAMSGAQGTVDTSNMQVLAGVYSMAKQIEMQEKSLALQDKEIEAQKYMNDMSNATSRYCADKGAYASMASAGTYASANRYASDNALFSAQYAADKSYENAHYAADRSYNASTDSAFIHGASSALPTSQAGALAAYTATKLGNAIVNSAKSANSSNSVFTTGNKKSKHR